LLHDLRVAARALSRRPGLLSLAVLNLGLGIAASTVVFSLVHGVLLRPLPYRGGDRMVVLWHQFGLHGQNLPALNPLDYRDYRARSRLIEEFTILAGREWVLDGDADAEIVDVGLVAANFFPFLGVDPMLGRHFLDAEDAAGGPPAVLIGHGLWRRRFGGDPGVIGRALDLGGERHVVVGVLPAGFGLLLPPEAFWLKDAQVWRPAQIDYAKLPPRNWTTYSVFARLRTGVSLSQAQAEMSAIAARLREEHPEHASADLRVKVVPFRDDVLKGASRGLWLLLGAVSLVLAIACVNVAMLLLARGRSLESEFLLRAALGAGRGQIARAVLAEGFVLSAGGAVLGLLLAPAALSMAKRLAAPHVPRLDAVSIDASVLALVAAVSALAALFLGSFPALRAARADLTCAFRDGARLTASRRETRSLAMLVVGQVAIAFVLVAGAGLAIRGFRALAASDSGFDPEGLLTLRLTLTDRRFPDAGSRKVFHQRLRERLLGLPGVRSVAAVSRLPLTGSGPPQPFAYDAETARRWDSVAAEWRRVTPGAFATLGATVLEGRDFADQDLEGGARRIVVDDVLARMAFAGRSAVGERLQIAPGGGPDAFAEIVGVVAHLDLGTLAAPVRPQFFEPSAAATSRFYLVIRASSRPEDLVAPVRREIAALGGGPVQEVRTMDDVVAAAMGPSRLALIVLSAFGAFSILLAGLGVYGSSSYAVVQETRQIAIRMALGERPAETRRRVLVRGLRTVGLGLALGVLGAVALSRLASASLRGVEPGDPLTYAVTALILAAIGLLAAWVPAERATRVDPLRSLREA
jgi:predicted permease